MLTDVVETFCLDEGIVSADERADVAHQVMYLFMNGTTDPVALAKLLRRQSSASPSRADNLKHTKPAEALSVEAAFMPMSKNDVHCG